MLGQKGIKEEQSKRDAFGAGWAWVQQSNRDTLMGMGAACTIRIASSWKTHRMARVSYRRGE